jgi:hypothetical protein
MAGFREGDVKHQGTGDRREGTIKEDTHMRGWILNRQRNVLASGIWTIITIHLLGLAPEGWVPFGPPRPLCAIEPAEWPDDRKTYAEEKDYDAGFGRATFCRTHTVFP